MKIKLYPFQQAVIDSMNKSKTVKHQFPSMRATNVWLLASFNNKPRPKVVKA